MSNHHTGQTNGMRHNAKTWWESHPTCLAAKIAVEENHELHNGPLLLWGNKSQTEQCGSKRSEFNIDTAEVILLGTRSVQIQHYYASTGYITDSVCIIRKIHTIKEWGTKEREIRYKDQKYPLPFERIVTYDEYRQAFFEMFRRNNPIFNHQWYVLIERQIDTRTIPKWFITTWWKRFGLTTEAMPPEDVATRCLSSKQDMAQENLYYWTIKHLKNEQRPWMLQLKYELNRPNLDRCYYGKWYREKVMK